MRISFPSELSLSLTPLSPHISKKSPSSKHHHLSISLGIARNREDENCQKHFPVGAVMSVRQENRSISSGTLPGLCQTMSPYKIRQIPKGRLSKMSLAATASPGTFIPWCAANRSLLRDSQLELTAKLLLQAQKYLFTSSKGHQEIKNLSFGIRILGRQNIKQKLLDRLSLPREDGIGWFPKSVVCKLEFVSESPTGLIEAQMSGPDP